MAFLIVSLALVFYQCVVGTAGIVAGYLRAISSAEASLDNTFGTSFVFAGWKLCAVPATKPSHLGMIVASFVFAWILGTMSDA